MKVIPLSEAKARLSHYGRLCREEAIVVTVNGSPAFQLVALDEEDDLIDQLLEHNASFRSTLENRLSERTISLKDAKRRL
jgi:antitoxin (DNA-binding transcriptional repressor) of toxin-antitoxin stability system